MENCIEYQPNLFHQIQKFNRDINIPVIKNDGWECNRDFQSTDPQWDLFFRTQYPLIRLSWMKLIVHDKFAHITF